MHERVNAWLSDLLKQYADAHKSVKVLVATHEATIAVLGEILLDKEGPFRTTVQPGVTVTHDVVNTSISHVTLTRNGKEWDCVIHSWSEHKHVPW